MSLFLSFSLCHPADGKFQVAVQHLGKPLHFQLLGLFRREREILFRTHFRSIDRRTGATKPYPDFTVKTSGMVRLVDGEYLAFLFLRQAEQRWICSNLFMYFRWSRRILQSELLMMASFTIGELMMSSTSWVTTTASPKYFRTVLNKYWI